MENSMNKEKTKDEYTWERLVKRFSEIPENRKTATQENLRWFLRNGAVMIHKYIEAEDAVYFAQKALKD